MNASPPTKGTTTLDHPEPAHRSSSVPAPASAPAPGLGRFFLFALLGLGLIFVLGLLPRLRERAVLHADAKELAVPSVTVVTPEAAREAAPLALSGELRPISEAALVARVGGYVKSWHADIGARVKAGDVLAELDTPELSQDLAKARAELAQAESAAKLASITAQRWQEMLKARSVSSQEADEKAADLTLKEATVNAARAGVQRLEQWVSFSKITAPFDGTVTERRLDVGQLVNTDVKEELYRLAQTEKLRVFIRVPQNHARSAKIGLTVDLTVPELPGRKFEAKIVRTAGALDAASRTLLTELEVDNSKGELFAGSYGLVRLTGGQTDAPMTVPANTIMFRPEGTMVAVVDANNRIALRTIELGRDFGTIVEVVTGLQHGEHVVLNPADSLLDGTPVHIATPPPDKPAEKK